MSRMLDCPNCNGTGMVISERGDTWTKDYFTCHTCEGEGRVVHPHDREKPKPSKKRRWFW